jgi:hypothetical protein
MTIEIEGWRRSRKGDSKSWEGMRNWERKEEKTQDPATYRRKHSLGRKQ